MNEEPTERLNERNSFESRVLTELAALGVRMSALEDKVDARLHETRPIWEAVLSRLELIDSKLDVLGLDMLEMRAEVERLKKRQPPAA
jgi:hypothetical protein